MKRFLTAFVQRSGFLTHPQDRVHLLKLNLDSVVGVGHG